MSRIMIAGTGSGCGKTTITCGLLGALKSMDKSVISFKAGPDYIDPMFHKKVTCIETRNLDVFLMGEENIKYSFSKHTNNKDISIIESAMGLYDGIGSEDYGSGNHMSILTQTPVILVVNVKGKSRSVCAEIYGYINYAKNNICGVILNNIQESMYLFYKDMIEKNLNIPVIGFMPNVPEAHLESRHLGLITANEVKEIQKKLECLAKLTSKYINIEKLISIAQNVKKIKALELDINIQKK